MGLPGSYPPQRTFHKLALTSLRATAAILNREVENDNHDDYNKISWTCFGKASSFNWKRIIESNENPSASLSRALISKLSNECRAILSSAYELTTVVIERNKSSNAFPELIAPLLDILKELMPHNKPVLPSIIQEKHIDLLTTLSKARDALIQSRLPLQWRRVSKAAGAIVMSNPKFQVDYALKKDIDPDRARVQLKQLNRQVKREQKGVVRELRRDADFLSQQIFKEKVEAQEKLKKERHANFAWMEEQLGTLNQHVKKGKGLLKGGGSGGMIKSRIKRK
jgi:hypothetical protein